jgi:CHAT domain-containing protein
VLSIGAPAVSDAEARGFTPLIGAREEAYKVARLYATSSVLVGSDATKERVLAKLSSANVVHFAGHAVAGSSDGRSRLLLAGPATEPRYALADTDLIGRVTHARVVLAACGTASDSAQRTSGAATISAAFLRSGARSVIGTLWDVDDIASGPFFLDVHRALVGGKTASQAVAVAQRACYASPACRGAVPTWVGTAAYGLE